MGFLDILRAKSGSRDACAVLEASLPTVRMALAEHAATGAFALREMGSATYATEHAHGPSVLHAGEFAQVVRQLVAEHPLLKKARRVRLGLGEDLLRTSVYHALFTRQSAGEKIDQAELQQLLEKAEQASRDDLMGQMGEGAEGQGGLALLASYIEEMRVDGYAVNSPIGMQGKEVEIILCNCYADPATQEFVKSVFAQIGAPYAHPISISYAVSRCFARAQLSAAPFSAIFIRVSEALTSVSVTLRNTFLGVKSFSVGDDTFIRGIAAQLGVKYQEALEIRKQYLAGTVSPAVARKVSGMLSKIADIWVSGVALALEGFSGELELFPSRMYLYGAGAGIPELIKALRESDRFSRVPFLEKRDPKTLEPTDLPFWKPAAPLAPVLQPTRADVGMLCLAYEFLSEEKTANGLDKLVRRAVRLAQ